MKTESQEYYNDNNVTGEGPTLNAGELIKEFVDENDLRSLRVRSEHIKRLIDVKSIIIVGSSGVGKSTLGRGLRQGFRYSERIVSFPSRVTTRTPRKDDNPEDGYSCSREEFEEMIDNGVFAMHWVRRDNPDRYGMLNSDSVEFPIYVAASAVVNNNSLKPREILDTALLVGIYAPDTIKNERISQRSSDIDETDLQVRYRDKAISIYPKVDLIVKNFGQYEKRTSDDLLALSNFTVDLSRRSRTENS